MEKYTLHLILGLLLLLPASRSAAGITTKSEAGQIGMKVVQLLEERHYNAKPVNDALSREMLKSYLDTLDYNHLFFLQSDIDQFQKYADALDDEMNAGNVRPALEIYEVYSNRVEQAVVAIKELVQEQFTFTNNETLLIDRREAPWPKDEAEWRALLRQRVKYELLEERLNKETPEDAIKTVTRRYDRLLRSLHENDFETIVGMYFDSLGRLYDPHTDYMVPSQFDNFAIDMGLSLTGIGAVLRSEDGYAHISSIVPGGPADLDKRLKVNDRIVAVAQGDGPYVDVVDMKLNKVVELIRGKKGTTVRLRVIPADAAVPSLRVEIAIVRDEIKLTEQEAKAKIIEKPIANGGQLRLGYIDLPSFYVDMKRGAGAKSSANDVRRLLQKLTAEKVDGVMLDLRRNTGGSLPEAISLTGLFIDEGPVVQVKDSQGKVAIGRDVQSGEAFDGPVVVLISHLSASASEILAAALQDYGRAIIIGDRQTFGKGTVQQLMPIGPLLPGRRDDENASGAMKLTIQKFYRVSGGSTQSRGVVPDIALPSVLDATKIGEKSLPHFLPYDEVPPASFTQWSRRRPPVEELNRRTVARLLKNPEFRYIAQDIVRLEKKQEEKHISLNEATRLAEKQEAEARDKKRQEERDTRPVAQLKTLEISLDSLDGKTNTVALTRQVMDEAMANQKAAAGKDKANGKDKEKDNKPAPDAHFDEGLNILADYIQMLGTMHAQN
ncbi:MAG: Tail-specific protease [Verrucomicrobiae bacterium]|nr:Tail-specific protease [Verrucomicrobiae bacterium]